MLRLPAVTASAVISLSHSPYGTTIFCLVDVAMVINIAGIRPGRYVKMVDL